MAIAQKLKFPRALTLKDVLQQAKVKDIIAVRDRESFTTPWRRVMLKKMASFWLLLDEKGKVLNEPECCPSTGFTQESLFEEVGMEYYDFPLDVGRNAVPEATDDDSLIPRSAPRPTARPRGAPRRRRTGLGSRARHPG